MIANPVDTTSHLIVTIQLGTLESLMKSPYSIPKFDGFKPNIET